jgi:cytochrome c biogenesis protein CcmG/thiol:disulfide interchange protein DsbE
MSEQSQERREAGAAPRRTLLALVPFVLAVIVGGFLLIGLELNPREIPSVLIGKPVPEFDLPPIDGRPPGLSKADLKGEVSLVNVFASWCVACRAEHPLLMDLKAQQIVPVHGLDYKDTPADARAWLARHGDPYERVGSDQSGRVGIEWGVYGVPETFLIDASGAIVCKHIGPITPSDWKDKLLPAVQALRAGQPARC